MAFQTLWYAPMHCYNDLCPSQSFQTMSLLSSRILMPMSAVVEQSPRAHLSVCKGPIRPHRMFVVGSLMVGLMGLQMCVGLCFTFKTEPFCCLLLWWPTDLQTDSLNDVCVLYVLWVAGRVAFWLKGSSQQRRFKYLY